MANFVIIVDPNPEQRSHFIKTIQPLLSPVVGLLTNSCAQADFCAVWTAHPHAPISYIREGLENFFQPEILRQLLPHAYTSIQNQSDAIIAASGLKTLIEFSLWTGEYFNV